MHAKLFVFWMLFASGLGFLKLLVLAYALAPTEYGHYVAYFGIATLAGTVVSAGLIERTIKSYPRLWVAGGFKLIMGDAGEIAKALTIRFFFLGGMCVALAFTGIVPVGVNQVVLTSGLGLCTALLALLASMYRAAGSLRKLQGFSVWRGLLAIVFALVGGWALGWQGAIAGDVTAAVAAGFYAYRQLRGLYLPSQLVNLPPVGEPDMVFSESTSGSGYWKLYAANLLLLSTLMGDRAWVGAALGAVRAGAYGVTMLIPQIAQLLVNVVVQFVGPLVIKYAHLKHHDTSHVSALGLQSVLLALFALGLTVSALVARRLPYADVLFSKFGISDLSLVLAGVIAAGQIYSLIEFHLIALDREHDVLTASAVSALVFFGLFVFGTLKLYGMEWFVASSGVARWTQVWILRRAYLRHGN